MSRTRAYRNPIVYVAIVVALLAAVLLVYFTPSGDSPAAGKRTIRNFDENVKLTASSSITLTFKQKGGNCSAQKCGQFQGKVTSPDSRCVAGRTVTIRKGTVTVATAVTDSKGEYDSGQLTGLSGTYTATVSASSGYGYTCDAASASVTV